MGCTAATAGLVQWWHRLVAPGLRLLSGESPARPAEVILVAVAGLALGVGAWLTVGVLLDLLALLPGWLGRCARSAAAAVAPHLARRLVAAVLGIGASTVALPATSLATPITTATHLSAASAAGSPVGSGSPAEPAPPIGSAASIGSPSRVESALRSPSSDIGAHPRPASAPHGAWVAAAPDVRPQPEASHLVVGPAWRAGPAGTVVVHRGDTLWGIAAAHLGPGATQAEISRWWPRWHATNRDVIGDDPDVLLPGQVLTIPEPDLEAAS